MSGKEIVAANSNALVATYVDKNDAPYEQRIKEAQELEAKLQHIQETVPTRIYNVSSSSAGAGSGEFHTYRMIIKAEKQMLNKLDKDWEEQQKTLEFEQKRKRAEEEAEKRTDKRRSKRQKKKEKKKEKKTSASSRDSDDDTDEGNDVERSGLLIKDRLAKACKSHLKDSHNKLSKESYETNEIEEDEEESKVELD
uniref:Uncharacterized protein n=1 Tax=Polytomella parva TaxID=51329 RepID=A0A7S0VQD7_9CHLO|mmetsp:Transcript_9170/g.17227  ORF Transcript_9170/g.17227 Transcript_9170/m.17227 type:complete len:196 (+) Transcript_9170:113-700(+)|eukprot:CAMPEP_0175059484 /NCGR_PEP_ID=MMETSP0052_2-20121109/12458_1 /TAXON_ID=51329 ORGANISM="Polytomella parva, Strain SAG 63-3" /NCGR_SAMPLE_ID=MMETSP0052_2 /ASSEMBLY_ACC=CAM_ASM_000194 /LENGTH=195 /DNA_ID=CAMNT_0016325039 /DNA_START=29 /DNA_END=616 /DNA_ORIENTATION=+